MVPQYSVVVANGNSRRKIAGSIFVQRLVIMVIASSHMSDWTKPVTLRLIIEPLQWRHMGVKKSQITGNSTVCSGCQQRKYQSPAWFPITKGQPWEKRFHLITSLWLTRDYLWGSISTYLYSCHSSNRKVTKQLKSPPSGYDLGNSSLKQIMNMINHQKGSVTWNRCCENLKMRIINEKYRWGESHFPQFFGSWWHKIIQFHSLWNTLASSITVTS